VNCIFNVIIYIYAIFFLLSGFAVAGPLHEAAKEGDLVTIKSLIAEGFDVNAKTKSGTTPLHVAAREGHKEVEGLLIKHGGHE